MLTDALAQYLVWKKWPHWFLVLGPTEKDKLYAEALRRSAKRFGAKIVEERTFTYDSGSRRTDGGFEQVQQQIPTFTQNAPDHDVLVVADEGNLFGDYLPYRTWDRAPRRRHRRSHRRELASGHRAVGRHAVPEPLQAPGRSHHAPARLQRVARRAHGRRGRLAHQIGQIRRPRRLHEGRRTSTSPASRASACRCATGTARSASRSWSRRRSFWSASRRSRASCIRSASSTRSASISRKPNARRTRNERGSAHRRCRHQKRLRRKSPNALQGRHRRAARPRFRSRPAGARGHGLHGVRHQREGQLGHGHRHREARGDQDLPGRPAPARHHPVERRQVADRLHQRRQHHPGLRHQDL